MAESEDRTQAPTKLRHQQAREHGQVAHSPELTSAAALMAGALMIGVVGEPLFRGLLTLAKGPWTEGLAVAMDRGEVVAHLRATAFAVLGPLVLLMLGLVAAGIGAHQAQVGLLWSPGLLAPNVTRLWGVGAGRGPGARAGRGLWSLAKTSSVLAVAVWAIRSRVDGLGRLGRLDIAALALAWAEALRGLLTTLAIAALALGLIDYALQRRRFEGMLQLTPEEAREDQKATDGDPALRVRRRQMARAWRGDAPELLAGATLIVAGDNDLIVILGGGPPPGRVSVRSAATGPTGRTIRQAARAAGVAVVEQPDLALALARLSNRANTPLAPGLVANLATVWPAS